jgi:hypothetical protein
MLMAIIREARLTYCELPPEGIECCDCRDHAKTDLNVALESLERPGHSRITALIFVIKAQAHQKENLPTRWPTTCFDLVRLNYVTASIFMDIREPRHSVW